MTPPFVPPVFCKYAQYPPPLPASFPTQAICSPFKYHRPVLIPLIALVRRWAVWGDPQRPVHLALPRQLIPSALAPTAASEATMMAEKRILSTVREYADLSPMNIKQDR